MPSPAMPLLWLPGKEEDGAVSEGSPLAAGPYPIDQHAAFRVVFATTAANTEVVLTHSGASWYNIFVDGLPVAEGPTRFTGMVPYCAETTVSVPAAGKHVVSIHAHSIGLGSRILLQTPPFVGCVVAAKDPAGKPLLDVAPVWRCRELAEYTAQWRRMSPLLGWMECCTLDGELQAWKAAGYIENPLKWVKPVPADSRLQPPVPLASTASPASSRPGPLPQTAEGTLSERFGYINDDPPARFLLRALTQKPSEGGPPGGGSPADPGFDPGAPQGKWWRFDSGRAQLLRPVLELAGCPAGTVIEVCYCQALIDGKCSPYHPLCGGAVCYMDRYTVGPDLATKAFTICPLEPRGCRYVEVHVLRDDDPPGLAAVSLTKATALYRSYDSYHVPPSGHFQATETASEAGGGWWGGSGQGGQGSETRQLPVTLEKIWAVGADTTRSCCEDSCIDGPCRERGMWLGDTAAVSLPNLVYMYDDIAIIRLMLQQTAYKASSTGVFSGNCPSGGAISDYALLWMEALAVYLQATGDRPAVAALWPACTKCVDYFLSPKCYTDAKGFMPPIGTGVIDWGYVPTKALGGFDVCLNGLLITALQAVITVGRALGGQPAAAADKYQVALSKHAALVKKCVGFPPSDGSVLEEPEPEVRLSEVEDEDGWVVVPEDTFDVSKLGFHGAAFLLRAGDILFGPGKSSPHKTAVVGYIKAQLEDCFPINKDAPRLSDPSKRSATGFYTPYFQTFTFAGLFAAGEADWCIGQYKQAWGWALTQSSTWLEVFDPRWEVVHSWGGCPTWQLSRYCLGLQPRLDAGPRHFALDLHVGTGQALAAAEGSVPSRSLGGDGAPVGVKWSRVAAATDGGAGSVHLTLTLGSEPAFVLGWPSAKAGAWTKLQGTVTAVVPNCV